MGSSEILSFVLAVLFYIGLGIIIFRIAKKIKSKEKKDKKEKEPTLTGFGPWFDLRIETKNRFDDL